MKDLLSLTELAICSGFEDIGKAIEEENRQGKVFDVRKLWESLTRNCLHGHGHGHAFPHPRLTHKDMDPAEFREFHANPSSYCSSDSNGAVRAVHLTCDGILMLLKLVT